MDPIVKQITIEFYKEIKTQKNSEIITQILDSYWTYFKKLNHKTKIIRFPRKSDFIREMPFVRRNAYKHIAQLETLEMFYEYESFFIPRSFTWKINNKIYNPSKFIAKEQIPGNIVYQIDITPTIPINIFRALTHMIKYDHRTLHYFTNIVVEEQQKISYKQDFPYNKLPKTSKNFAKWNHKNLDAKEKEDRLYSILTNKTENPFDLNTLVNSPLNPYIKISPHTRKYVFAGAITHFGKIKTWSYRKGAIDDEDITTAKIKFYDENKNKIGEKFFSFPGSNDKNTIPIMEWKAGVCSEIKGHKANNPNFLGYYAFRNYHPMFRGYINHYYVSFATVNVPEKTKYIRVKSSKSTSIALINFFPKEDYPSDIIEDYMNSEGKYIQKETPILRIEDNKNLCCYESLKKINILAKKILNSEKSKRDDLAKELTNETIHILDLLIKQVETVLNTNDSNFHMSRDQLINFHTLLKIPAYVRWINRTLTGEEQEKLLLNLEILEKLGKFSKIVDEKKMFEKENIPNFRVPYIMLGMQLIRHLEIKRDLPIGDYTKKHQEFLNVLSTFKSIIKPWDYSSILLHEKLLLDELFFKSEKIFDHTLKLYEEISNSYMQVAEFTKNSPIKDKDMKNNYYILFKNVALHYWIKRIELETTYYSQESKDSKKYNNILMKLKDLEKRMF